MAKRKQTSRPSEKLFADDQRDLFEKSYEEQLKEDKNRPVEKPPESRLRPGWRKKCENRLSTEKWGQGLQKNGVRACLVIIA